MDDGITGIVLAGGESRRMGRDKAALELGGRPLLEWVLNALREVTTAQLVVARTPAAIESVSSAPVVGDRLSAPGPVTGLHAGLEASESELNIVVAVDMPLVEPRLLWHLATVIGEHQAAVPCAAQRAPSALHDPGTARDAGIQPLCAAYRRRCTGLLERLLEDGPQPAVVMATRLDCRLVPRSQWARFDPDGRSFTNVNTPADLSAAERLLAAEDA